MLTTWSACTTPRQRPIRSSTNWMMRMEQLPNKPALELDSGASYHETRPRANRRQGRARTLGAIHSQEIAFLLTHVRSEGSIDGRFLRPAGEFLSFDLRGLGPEYGPAGRATD